MTKLRRVLNKITWLVTKILTVEKCKLEYTKGRVFDHAENWLYNFLLHLIFKNLELNKHCRLNFVVNFVVSH